MTFEPPADAPILCADVGTSLESIGLAQELLQWRFTAVDFDPLYHTI